MNSENNMIIPTIYVDYLDRIYNTLFEISTKGEDTLIMADCIKAFKDILTQFKENKPVEKE